MINILKLTMFVSMIILSGCYAGITGRVIDAETQHPIEGAIVLVEWTKTEGYPFSATKSIKAVEVISDKNGTVDLPGIADPFVNLPHVTVYKQGYVAWNNQFIFPGYKERTDFKWSNDYVFQLEIFKSEYSHNKHYSFITNVINKENNSMDKINIINSIEFERQKAVIENKEEQLKVKHK